MAAALNADTHLQAIDLTSSTVSSTVLTSAKTFSSNPMLPQGSSALIVSAVDGGNNTKSNSYQISTKGSANQPLTYDRNGNLTSDGTNTYLWDAENRLIQINYPGTGNNSRFMYDPQSRAANIVETVSGTINSTKQFVWCMDKKQSSQPCEARSSSGLITAQYFRYGQTIASANYFYSKDGHPGSVRELTDGSANIQSSYSYDPYGRPAQVQGSLPPDFQYANYYFHARSGLNLTLNRAFNSTIGRWINRDPIGENGGLNLYTYVDNEPISSVDPSGTSCLGGDGPKWGTGYGWGSDPSLGWGWTPGGDDDDGGEDDDPPVVVFMPVNPQTRSGCLQGCFKRYQDCKRACWGRPDYLDCLSDCYAAYLRCRARCNKKYK